MFVSKTYWRRLQDMSSRHLEDMSSRRLQDIFSVTIFHLPRRLRDVFKMSSRHLERRKIDTLKTCWRSLQDMSWIRLHDVLKTNKCLLGSDKTQSFGIGPFCTPDYICLHIRFCQSSFVWKYWALNCSTLN